MNGLELSKEYFEKIALPALERDFPDIMPRLAAGLVGNGSECFGFDDELSRDHDWGVEFFLWVPEDTRDSISQLSEWKRGLFAVSPPPFIRKSSDYGASVGVSTVGEFYKSLTGLEHAPQTLGQWINIPEENLAMAVNGQVFLDNGGQFSQIRAALLDYFPEDLRLKRLSYACMKAAQTGQYNLPRCFARGDIVTARTTLQIFIDNVIHAVFLLNRRYRPYFKWRFRAMTALPLQISGLAEKLTALAETELSGQSVRIIDSCEDICSMLAQTLRSENLTVSPDVYLIPHGEELRAKIQNPALRDLPAQYGI